jgi:hypothetical protein
VAAQVEVVKALGRRAADPHARHGEGRVRLHVGVLGRPDIADDVGEQLGLRVDAGGADIDQHAGKVGGIDLDLRHLVPAQEVLEHHGDVALMGPQLAQDAGSFAVGERHELGEGVEHGGGVVGLLHHEQRAPVLPVGGKLRAIAVEDAATGRGEQPHADGVAARHGGVFGAVHHLHLVEPGPERAEDRDLCAGHKQRAAGEDSGVENLALHASAARGMVRLTSVPARPGCDAPG